MTKEKLECEIIFDEVKRQFNKHKTRHISLTTQYNNLLMV